MSRPLGRDTSHDVPSQRDSLCIAIFTAFVAATPLTICRNGASTVSEPMPRPFLAMEPQGRLPLNRPHRV
jgi:hypothetical protein